jgi:hypothetical protein
MGRRNHAASRPLHLRSLGLSTSPARPPFWLRSYDTHLVVAERSNLSKALSTGFTVGCMMFVMFSL